VEIPNKGAEPASLYKLNLIAERRFSSPQILDILFWKQRLIMSRSTAFHPNMKELISSSISRIISIIIYEGREPGQASYSKISYSPISG
jgi:hypothetical protein